MEEHELEGSTSKVSEEKMEPKDYIVSKIEGEYATLKDLQSGEELFIAMALLPPNVDLGTRLHYEMLTYTVC